MGTVLVANKMPYGIHLDVEKRERVTILGTAMPHGVQRETALPGGYMLTPVDEEHWNAWAEANKELSLIKTGMIFAEGRRDAARGRAVEQADFVTGVERIDPERLPAGLETFKSAY